MSQESQARWQTSDTDREDIDFMRDVQAALYDAPPQRATRFLTVCAALLASFLIWAYFAKIDEVARGAGSVVPSSKKQVIQSLESGIVRTIKIRQGDKVKKGQILIQMDDTRSSSDFGELLVKRVTLLAQTIRIKTELTGGQLTWDSFPANLLANAGPLLGNERDLFNIRKRNLRNQIDILKDRSKQRKLELEESKVKLTHLEKNLAIANQEHALKAPLTKRGIVPKTDLLKLEREVAGLEGQIAVTKTSIPRMEAAILESDRLIEEQKLSFRQTGQLELNRLLADLAIVEESVRAAKDRVYRTDIRSPVDGFVNQLGVNTVGGVIKAGEILAEITPIDEKLLIEAKIDPKDIAFIHKGQKALTKITAYDFSIFGGIDGVVHIVSSDSVYDEVTKTNYYLVTIKLDQSTLPNSKESLHIIPGMVASVDIITGNKSVLQYIIKPFLKAHQEALRER